VVATKILVYGAGPLGSLFAARLKQAGHEVSLLARGKRLDDLQEHGVVLQDVITGVRTVTRVSVVEELAVQDTYDLVLVVMRKNHALAVLPVLAANERTPNVLFLMNNAAGSGELVQALGRERVLIGFPYAVGYLEGSIVHFMAGTEGDESAVPLGEVDGRITDRTRWVAQVLASAPGFGAEIRTDMDAWLKYHVALLMPALVPALYLAGTDCRRLGRTRDAVLLAVLAGREGFRVLRALGLPVTPSRLRILEWLPEPLLVPLLQRVLADDKMEVALVHHARSARDEMQHLADEFLALARTTAVPTPVIDRLYLQFRPGAPLMPDGSAEIPLDWRGLWLGAGVLVASLVGIVALIAALRQFGRRATAERA
jgi:2-dehydropantoate 2-reductase